MTFDPREFTGLRRRDFLRYLVMAGLAACGGRAGVDTTAGPGTTSAPGPATTVGAPEIAFEEP